MILLTTIDYINHKLIINNINTQPITSDITVFNLNKIDLFYSGWIWIPTNGNVEINLNKEIFENTKIEGVFVSIVSEGNILLEEAIYFEEDKNKKTFRLESFDLTLHAGDLISEYIVKFNKFWESDLFFQFLPYLNNIKNIVDCGANIGNHSLMFHKYFPESNIYSFEPSSTNYELLLTNTKKIKNIHTFKTALSSKRGTLFMENPALWNRGSTAISESGELVQSSLLDDFGFDNISFMKIDVEGHEQELIRGSINTIVNHRPYIWIEDFTGQTKTFLEEKLGYTTLSAGDSSNYLLGSNHIK
jgi:FkbM family methyltransferase